MKLAEVASVVEKNRNNVKKENSSTRNIHVVWFKTTDLRLHDHLPLLEAHALAKEDGSAVIHLVALDSIWYDKYAKSREAKLSRVGYLN